MSFKQCQFCKEGFDTNGPSGLTYPGQDAFCKTCSDSLTPNGWELLEAMSAWVDKFQDAANYQKNGLRLTMFNAIRNRAPREALYNAIIYYTGGRLEATIQLAEMLEQYSEFLENKRPKPLESNYNANPNTTPPKIVPPKIVPPRINLPPESPSKP